MLDTLAEIQERHRAGKDTIEDLGLRLRGMGLPAVLLLLAFIGSIDCVERNNDASSKKAALGGL